MDAVTLFDQTIKQYESAIGPMKLLSAGFARDTFSLLGVIALAAALLNHLLRVQVDAAEANIELVKITVTLFFFFLLIQSYPEWLPLIGKTFRNMGISLAGQNADFATHPGNVVKVGIKVGMDILNYVVSIGWWKNLVTATVAVFCSGVIVYCFARIAIEVLLIEIGSRIILGIGICMLGFAGTPWTRPYAEKYISTMFNLGIKMLFIYVLVGIGCEITKGWQENLVNGGPKHLLDNVLAMSTATYVYYMICLKVPDMASSMLSGHTALGFGAGDANIRSVMQGGAIAAGLAVGSVFGGMGAAKAIGMAYKASTDQTGGKPSTFGAIKTLGAAAGSRIKEKFYENISNTTGGRLSNHIKSISKGEKNDATYK